MCLRLLIENIFIKCFDYFSKILDSAQIRKFLYSLNFFTILTTPNSYSYTPKKENLNKFS